LLTGSVRADGIALSTDGLIWTKGVGAFGDGWGNTGTGISVREGETLYIKFYSSTRTNIALCYAEHGRDWDSWKTTGPAVDAGAGDSLERPIVLRISKIGTPSSAVMWMNGNRTSGMWSAFTETGAYDLGLRPGEMWTVPPINVTKAPPSHSFWADLFGWLKSDTPEPTNAIHSVPDGGASVALLTLALLVLAAVRRKINSTV
jgi:hypothetical protein